jgi:hypothetical protein
MADFSYTSLRVRYLCPLLSCGGLSLVILSTANTDYSSNERRISEKVSTIFGVKKVEIKMGVV